MIKNAPRDAYSREEETSRKGSREPPECVKAHSLLFKKKHMNRIHHGIRLL